MKILIILMLVVMILSSGCINSANEKTPNNNSLNDIGLTIDDMPSGWADIKGISVYAMNGTEPMIQSRITKYDTIDEAQQAFMNLKSNYANIKLESVGFGDESFAYEYGTESQVVFRKNNIVVETVYLKQNGSSSIGDSKKYAEIVFNRIE